MKSPGRTKLANCRASASVAASSTSAIASPTPAPAPCVAAAISGRRARLTRRAVDREHAGHRRALAVNRVDLDPAAVQLDQRPDNRQAEAGAAMARASGVALETVEDPVEHLI